MRIAVRHELSFGYVPEVPQINKLGALMWVRKASPCSSVKMNTCWSVIGEPMARKIEGNGAVIAEAEVPIDQN